ncbi:MAG: F0F1 ATP synthase subunit gamma [Candidatus Roseilinea sp.]|uniref:F0F1 ATP synthase subunit gamma n=1 Tax=Candidatus Roseilinea sp. TaxID=2838777 RepID=UPI00404944A2
METISHVSADVVRGIALSPTMGHIPSRVGYQPTLASELAELQERISNTQSGAITSVRAVYVPAAGARAASYLIDGGFPDAQLMPASGTVQSITHMVREALLVIDDWRMNAEVTRVFLFYNRRTSGALYQPHMERLAPVNVRRASRKDNRPDENAWPARSVSLFTMPREQLLSALIRQHIFVSLFRAFAESMASENASRLAAMQAAENNIRDRLAELNAQYHTQRQSLITSEILDIISGFEALTQPPPAPAQSLVVQRSHDR